MSIDKTYLICVISKTYYGGELRAMQKTFPIFGAQCLKFAK
jgi:hypothetical protein